MNVLSLFDGMSCGRIALERAGIPVTNYFSSEIDKYAIQVSNDNYPDIIRLGNVLDVKSSGLSSIDLLIAGSPCQGFSFAGKMLNFEDPRSKLFFEFVRVLSEIRGYNPDVKFLLENVKMKKEHQDIISSYLGVEPELINSGMLSAQNRKRLYWTNIIFDKIDYDYGLVLRDVLENKPFDKESKTLNTNPSVNGMNGKIHSVDRKSPCLTTNKGEGVKITDCIKIGIASDINGHDIIKRIYSTEGKSPTLTAVCGGNQEVKIPVDCYLTKEQVERGQYQASAKTWKSGNKMGNMDFPNNIDKKAKTLTVVNTKGGRETNHVLDVYYYRKLTPIECERLQTVPDNYTQSVSNSQRYKMLGNGWTVDVIAHIFKGLR